MAAIVTATGRSPGASGSRPWRTASLRASEREGAAGAGGAETAAGGGGGPRRLRLRWPTRRPPHASALATTVHRHTLSMVRTGADDLIDRFQAAWSSGDRGAFRPVC